MNEEEAFANAVFESYNKLINGNQWVFLDDLEQQLMKFPHIGYDYEKLPAYIFMGRLYNLEKTGINGKSLCIVQGRSDEFGLSDGHLTYLYKGRIYVSLIIG